MVILSVPFLDTYCSNEYILIHQYNVKLLLILILAVFSGPVTCLYLCVCNYDQH